MFDVFSSQGRIWDNRSEGLRKRIQFDVINDVEWRDQKIDSGFVNFGTDVLKS